MIISQKVLIILEEHFNKDKLQEKAIETFNCQTRVKIW